METLGYYNGKYDVLENMQIPMNDRVCWFGDGVYDAGPCRNYRIFALHEHIDRFYRNAAKMDIEIPMCKDELASTLETLVRKLDSSNLFVYYQVTRGTAIRNHTYSKGPGNLWIMMKPAKVSYGFKAISLITCEDTRYFHCDVKTLNLLPNVMASQKAQEAGCSEAVFYREGGRVTECAHSNIHILKDGALFTAPTDHLILPGIARAHLIRACNRLSIPVREEAFTLDALFNADEVIVTSSSNLCLRVDVIDGKNVGGKDPHCFERIRYELINEFERETTLL